MVCSIRMRSIQNPPSTRLDTSLLSRRLRLHTHRPGSRKQYYLPPLQHSFCAHVPTDLGAVHKIGAPIHVYPLYENAFRAHRGQSLKANNEESARLYADFSAVAAGREFAWREGERSSEEEIGTVGGRNRMICWPCIASLPYHSVLVCKMLF